MSDHKLIGVFDSGFGGIDILKSLVRDLSQYSYLYLGDTARTPYGTRSKEVVYDFTKQAIEFLFDEGSELVILACNTASSDALRKFQQEELVTSHPGKKVLGVLIPSAEEAVQMSENKRVGVIATEGTTRSAAFVRELTKIDPGVEVFQQACPLLVPLVEAGEHNGEAAQIILRNYLSPLLAHDIDTLILGCTHYGILEGNIRKIVGPEVNIIAQGEVVVKKLKNYLDRHPEIEDKLSKTRGVRFYTTDLTDKFKALGSEFFGTDVTASLVNLE